LEIPVHEFKENLIEVDYMRPKEVQKLIKKSVPYLVQKEYPMVYEVEKYNK